MIIYNVNKKVNIFKLQVLIKEKKWMPWAINIKLKLDLNEHPKSSEYKRVYACAHCAVAN